MKKELRSQYCDAVADLSTGEYKISPDKFCQKLIRILTNNLSPTNWLVEMGIAYVNHRNKVCLASRWYIKWALEDSGYIVKTKHDTQALKELAILNIMCRKCDVENCEKARMKVPIATGIVVQDKIGDIPSDTDVEEGSVTLLKLAPSHPVVDLLLIDKQSKDMEVYFIQVSSQTYNDQKKKRNDLDSTMLTQGSAVAVNKHYHNHLSYKKAYFVYATPESECYAQDKEVYILDLKEQVFNNECE